MAGIVPSRRVRGTPFSAGVQAAGAKAYTVYNHMLLPSYFESYKADYLHLKNYVQVWDVSVERQVSVKGTDAAKLMKIISPRDMNKMAEDQCYYMPICDDNGGMLNDPVAIKLAEDHYWLSIADGDLLQFLLGLAIGSNFEVEISEPFGPMNAGTDTILTVTVKNKGNSQDGVSEVDVKDDCPLLTTDNGLDSLLSGNIEAGKEKDANLRISASESHPKRHCDITITITSKRDDGAGLTYAEDEVRVTVEPPPTEESTSGSSNSGDGRSEDAIESNLAAPGAIFSMVCLLGAMFSRRKEVR